MYLFVFISEFLTADVLEDIKGKNNIIFMWRCYHILQKSFVWENASEKKLKYINTEVSDSWLTAEQSSAHCDLQKVKIIAFHGILSEVHVLNCLCDNLCKLPLIKSHPLHFGQV